MTPSLIKLYQDSAFNLYKCVVGPLDNNVYILQCRDSGESVLIDAANEDDYLQQLCETYNVRNVLETHGHDDHIAAVPALRDAGYNVAISAQDSSMLKSYDQILIDEAIITIGRLKVEVIHTPGHTPGSLSFHLQDSPLLFSGDTLFPGGPGATHFPGGNFQEIINSIERKLFARFDGTTIVLPGHGDNTTIANEAPNLNEWISRGY